MKYFGITLIALAFFIGSCKKQTNPLIGKWAEQTPCVAGVGACYDFELRPDGKYYLSSPSVDTDAYTINDGKITFAGNIGRGTYDYQLINSKTFIIEKIYTGAYFDTPFFHKDIMLLKVN